MTGVLSPAERADLQALIRAWCRQRPGASSVAEAEQLAGEAGRVVAECLFACGVQQCGTRAGYQGSFSPCSCGARARFTDYRFRWVRGLHGEARASRAYYHCRACGKGQAPWDRLQGLDRQVFTPALKGRITELCARLPYREAKEVLERFSGLALAESTLEGVTTAVGQRLREAEDERVCRLFEHGRHPSADPFLARVLKQRLYLSIDAAKAHTDGNWHDIKVAACYRGVSEEPGLSGEGVASCQRDGAGETRYLAVQEEAEAFGRRLYTWALALGCERARELVVLGDGAEWIWKLVRHHFSDVVEILDFYHACEHVWEIARSVFGEQNPAGQRWARRHCERLEKHGPDALLRALRSLQQLAARRSLSESAQETVRVGRDYFLRHRERMQYPRYRKAGLMIGSGPVEAACKVVVGARLKQAGMRWSAAGADALLAARTAVLADQYDEIALHAWAA